MAEFLPQEVPAHRAREYETIYILRPNAGEEAAEKVANRIIDVCDKLDGKLVEVDVWGRRRLAYKIKGHSRGVFIYLRYLGYPGLVAELERNLKMLDGVLKYQTVKLNHEIDPATVEVDPEAIQFEGVDFSDEPDEELEPEEGEDEGSRGSTGGYLEYEPEPSAEPDIVRDADAKADETPAEETTDAPAEATADAPAEPEKEE